MLGFYLLLFKSFRTLFGRIFHIFGIGINFKVGKDFRLSDKMILNIAPEFIVPDIVPFKPEKNQQRLTDFGLRLSHKFGL